MIGATAAIALPPQIAVPTVIKIPAVLFTLSIRPASNPAVKANAMLTAVYTNPLRPARNTSCRFIPKPSPTTDACSKYFVAVRDSVCQGCVKANPNISPSASAAAGDTSPLAHNANPTRNRIFTATNISAVRACRQKFRPRPSFISSIPPRCSPGPRQRRSLGLAPDHYKNLTNVTPPIAYIFASCSNLEWTRAPLLVQIMGVPLTLFGHLGEIRYAILCHLTRARLSSSH